MLLCGAMMSAGAAGHGEPTRRAQDVFAVPGANTADTVWQEQRRFLCARIAAAVEASGVPAPSARRRHRRPSEHYGKIVLTPAPLFWVMAGALVAQEEFLTWWQFQWHYRAQLASQL